MSLSDFYSSLSKQAKQESASQKEDAAPSDKSSKSWAGITPSDRLFMNPELQKRHAAAESAAVASKLVPVSALRRPQAQKHSTSSGTDSSSMHGSSANAPREEYVELFSAVLREHRYDPAFPNDYDEILDTQRREAQRLALKAAEEEERRRKEEAEKRKALDGSDEEEVLPVPDPAQAKKKGAFTQKTMRMMQKMGWSGKGGLGKDEKGIAAPLEHRKTGRNVGSIVMSEESPASANPLWETLQQQNRGNLSTVVLLRNMVGRGAVDEELEDEVAGECGKYGEVENCITYELTDESVRPSEAVRIFVKFATTDAAQKAVSDLHGRFFDGRQVNARFFSEELFGTFSLDPTEEEEIVEE